MCERVPNLRQCLTSSDEERARPTAIRQAGGVCLFRENLN